MRRHAPKRAGVAACLLATLLVVLATAVVTAGSQGCGPTGAPGGAACAAEPDVIVDDVTTGGIGGAPDSEATAIGAAPAAGESSSHSNSGASSALGTDSGVSEPPVAGDPAPPVDGEVPTESAPLAEPAPDSWQQPPAPAAARQADGATAPRRLAPSPGPQASEAEDPVLGASPALDAATESSSVADESQVLLVSSGGDSKWRWPLGLLLAGVALLGVPWLAGRRSPARAR